MKIGKIILIVLGVALLALGVKGLMDIPGQQAMLDAAVYLDEPVVLPENEGKLVIVHGSPEMIAPAVDKELGLTLNTFKAIRYTEAYKRSSKEDTVETYQWVAKGSKTITGEAALGGFMLDEKTIGAFPADNDFEDFDPAQLSARSFGIGYGKTTEGARTSRLWVIDGGEYYYDAFEYHTSHDIPLYQRELDKEIVVEREGAQAYAYRIYDAAGNAEWTLAGIQQGNRLVTDETLGPVVRSGILTKEQMLSSNKVGIIGGAAVFMLIGAVLVFLGIRKHKTKERLSA